MGRLLNQYLIDIFLQCLHTHVGGNKAQCHGNHIKSTLKLIYLKSNGNCVYIKLFLCMFYDPMSISVIIFLEKKNNQVRAITLWFIKDYDKSHI